MQRSPATRSPMLGLVALAFPARAAGKAFVPRISWTGDASPTSRIQRAFHDGSGAETIAPTGASLFGMALDSHRGKVYWSDTGGTITRANLDGSAAEGFPTGLGSLRGLAPDPMAGKLYFADFTAPGAIRRVNVDRTFLCRLDAGTFDVCTSPASDTGLDDGRYGFAVRTRDTAGNESSAASTTRAVDTTPPAAPAITSAPGNPTSRRTPPSSSPERRPA